MSSNNEDLESTIPKIDTINIFKEGEPMIRIEHFFDIGYLEYRGLSFHETILNCGIQSYFIEPQTIHLEPTKMFWRNAEF